MFLPTTFFPNHEENKMKSEGDVASARDSFLKNKPTNLAFLLESRFTWMNKYLENLPVVYELGCGAGFSKQFIKNKNFKLTDVTKRPWVDLQVDALNLPFEKESVNALVCSHMIHHLASPKRFLNKAHEVLKPGGLIIIGELHTSLFMRFLLFIMKHEGWSYEINVFDENTISNDPKDPWSANCAIPELLFKDTDKFHTEFPGFKIIHNELTEGIIFPLSGGVIARKKVVNLPVLVLKIIKYFDDIMILLFPNIFALGMRVVLQKI